MARYCSQNHNIRFDLEKDSKHFNFTDLEKRIYDWWEQEGYFKPSDDMTKEPYVVIMPPPNVTGRLHVGHALFSTLQDILIRYNRMQGKATFWLPGTDHAGIATQLLVERELATEGTSRLEIGREAFMQRIWEWKKSNGGQINQQLRRLGASADWSQEKFTLDQDMSAAVIEAFIRLHDKGLVYKGDYMVNWSVNLQTAVSDLEVDYTEEEGKLYHFKYMLHSNKCNVGDGSDEDVFIPVSTTRPETILGDTAVCVHPEDMRYAHLIGRSVIVPMSGGRTVPVLADSYVDMEFGTGALKITPAHDINDYAIGRKHNLETISIMNKDGTINEHGGKYAGMDRFHCREILWRDIEEAGLALKTEQHTMRVPRSQRGGEVIEPMISEQWFIKMDDMAKRAISAANNKDIVFIPERFDKVWFSWLENIRDWCVSRQLWWGHRIPVYYIGEDRSQWVVARNLEEAARLAKAKFGTDENLVQDENVLDTWFSSGLWPFSTLGWPHDGVPGSQLERYYPTAVMETGYDILFFWVARMVMLGLEFTDKVPFRTIYLHGIVRDGSGQKMSKTTGNVIDPIDTMNTYGCDALRYTLAMGATAGQDVSLDEEKIKANRNFVNKLWNAGKYISMSISSLSAEELESIAQSCYDSPMSLEQLKALPLAERYICSRCHEVTEDVTVALDKYQFAECGRLIYDFLWDEYADWFIEVTKTRGGGPTGLRAKCTLVYVWDRCLRLLHPFMPFLTETLWQLIPHVGDSVMTSHWPTLQTGQRRLLAVDQEAIKVFRDIQAIIRAVRNTRAEYSVDPKKRIAASIYIKGDLTAFKEEAATVAALAKIDANELRFIFGTGEGEGLSETGQRGHVRIVVNDGCEVWLPLDSMIDREKEIARMAKQAAKLRSSLIALSARLDSNGFASKAPQHVVDEVRVNFRQQEDQLMVLEKRIDELKSS